VAKFKNHTKEPDERFAPVDCGYQTSRRVFSPDSGKEFASCLRHSNEIIFGLTPTEVRNFEYECAVKFNVKVSDIWRDFETNY
jgi:hypothetical protein